MTFTHTAKKHKNLIFLTLAALTFSACSTLPQPTSSIESAAIVSEQTLRAERLDALLETSTTQSQVPGMSILVYDHGKESYYGQAGLRDREANTPIARSDVGRYFSMTKPIIGVALMRLYEDGMFDLDDPIEKHLPEYTNLQVFDGENDDGVLQTTSLHRSVTIRDLMRHTSGMTYGLFSNTPVDMAYRKALVLRPDENLEAFSAKLGKLPLRVQPGEQWIYSVSVDVQARLIEVLSGQTVGAYLQDNIFNPLGMTHTGFVVKESDQDKFGPAYVVDNSTGTPVFIRLTDQNSPKITRGVIYQIDGNFLNKQALESGGGGLVSSIDDYAKFAKMLLQGGTLGKTRILKTSTLALMSQDHLGAIDNGNLDASMGFGLDFAVKVKQIDDPDSMPIPTGSYYWGGLAGTYFWIDPTNELFVVVHMQFINPLDSTLRNAVARAVYGK